MYSVLELARMYNTSKQTMYTKVKSEEMKPYIIDGEDGIKVDATGLNILNLIMANSKIAKGQVDGQDKAEVIRKHTGETDDHLTHYINHLKQQIDELKKEKEELKRDKKETQNKLEIEKQEIQVKLDQLINLMINKQQQLEAPKVSIFSRIFKTNSM